MTITEIIEHAKSILIIGHQRPDGDCIGAGLTLRHVCNKHGKSCDFVVDSPVPTHFSFLPDFASINMQNAHEYDTVICVDCADHMRTGKFEICVRKAKVSVNIDHHCSNNRFAQINIVFPNASSTCEILFDMLDALGEIDDISAYYLFVGLSTDTGHFRHSNTTTHVFEIASRLTQYAVNAGEIAKNLYKNTTRAKVQLISRAIQSMRFFVDERVCVICIMQKDLEECGCVLADTEGIIDYGMMIGSVDVAVCITEQHATLYKVSYRSKNIDVAAAAAVFGGGGHKLAAGCAVHGKYEDVVRKVLKSVTDGMDI